MDLTTIIGIFSGLGLIVWAIMESGDLRSFYDFTSILITIGGTFAATFASFPFETFKCMGKHIGIVVIKPKHNAKYYIDTIVELAFEARKNGILSLEDKAANIKDKFLSSSVILIVDAIDPEKTKEMLQNQLESIEVRHSASWRMYEKAAAFAPSFGMIGTLIGLINMLANLDMNAENGTASLTSGMAIALITTLYGSLIANLVFMPIANKLRVRHDEELLVKEIVSQGVIAIQAGDNPRYIEQKLHAFLTNSQKNKKSKKKNKSIIEV